MSQWEGCYDDGWKGYIVPDSFSHPAKVARGLARRIYAHAREEGWLKPGMTVVDPFGGICGTALYAAAMGVHWIGVELEEKFVKLNPDPVHEESMTILSLKELP